MIVGIVERHGDKGRTSISERVCRALRWRQPNGALKDMACREILRKLDMLGVVTLPPRKWGGAIWPSRAYDAAPGHECARVTSVEYTEIQVHRIASKHDVEAATWNKLVQRYHYLHTSRIVGRQIKYLVFHHHEPRHVDRLVSKSTGAEPASSGQQLSLPYLAMGARSKPRIISDRTLYRGCR
jgi:hypothetical protein